MSSKNAIDFCTKAITNLNNKQQCINKYNQKQVNSLKKNSPVKTGALKRSIKNNNGNIQMNSYALTTNDGNSEMQGKYWIEKSIEECKEEMANEIINNIFK